MSLNAAIAWGIVWIVGGLYAAIFFGAMAALHKRRKERTKAPHARARWWAP